MYTTYSIIERQLLVLVSNGRTIFYTFYVYHSSLTISNSFVPFGADLIHGLAGQSSSLPASNDD